MWTRGVRGCPLARSSRWPGRRVLGGPRVGVPREYLRVPKRNAGLEGVGSRSTWVIAACVSSVRLSSAGPGLGVPQGIRLRTSDRDGTRRKDAACVRLAGVPRRHARTGLSGEDNGCTAVARWVGPHRCASLVRSRTWGFIYTSGSSQGRGPVHPFLLDQPALQSSLGSFISATQGPFGTRRGGAKIGVRLTVAPPLARSVPWHERRGRVRIGRVCRGQTPNRL